MRTTKKISCQGPNDTLPKFGPKPDLGKNKDFKKEVECLPFQFNLSEE